MTEDELRQLETMRYTNGENLKSIYTALGLTKPWLSKWLNGYRMGDT
jgi:hypothetical protein